MLHRLILKVTKFQLPPPKRLSTVVKNIFMAPMSNRVKTLQCSGRIDHSPHVLYLLKVKLPTCDVLSTRWIRSWSFTSSCITSCPLPTVEEDFRHCSFAEILKHVSSFQHVQRLFGFFFQRKTLYFHCSLLTEYYLFYQGFHSRENHDAGMIHR